MPKISLIVPVYKVENYLKICLDSLIGQTLRDIEIILIDDGSPDQCGVICDEYAARDDRIRVIHKRNEGVSVARNVGIDLATSEWLTFVDADDWVEPELCATVLAELQRLGAEVIIWDFIRHFPDREVKRRAFTESPLIREKKEKILFQLDIFTERYDDKIVKEKNVVLSGVWNCLYKTALIKENRISFPEGVSIYEDALFNLRVFEQAVRIAYLNRYLSHHRQWDHSASYAFRPDWLELSERIIKAYEAFRPREESLTEHPEVYREIVDIIRCNCLIGIITRYLLHEENPGSFQERMRLLKSVLRDNETKAALRRIEFKHFNLSRRFLLTLARHQLAGPLWFVYKAKSLKANFSKNNWGG